MTTTDARARLTSTDAVADLADLASGDGPFLTVLLPAPSEHADSEHRLDVRWKNARRDVEEQWDADLLADLDAVVEELDHADGESFAFVQRADGRLLVEPMAVGLTRTATLVGDAPRLVEILEHRQRTLAHIVVDTDRTGADVVAFDGGQVVGSEEVDGDTEHVHRHRQGGWSHRRFQQRAENTWERNAGDVAETVVAFAERIDPELIAVAGDVRAKRLVVEALPPSLAEVAVELDTGDPDSMADEVLRLLDDRHARLRLAVVDALRSSGGLTEADQVTAALEEGRVDTLLVSDDVDRSAVVDPAVVAAFASATAVVVVPALAEVADGIAAITRW